MWTRRIVKMKKMFWEKIEEQNGMQRNTIEGRIIDIVKYETEH